jgi:hypothetical protein
MEPLFITTRAATASRSLAVQPTWLTAGPWSAEAQHGGPPSGLLAFAIDQYENAVDIESRAIPPFMLARITIDLLRPVPLTTLTVGVRMIRPGKRVQLVESSLWANGEPGEGIEVARATGMRVRQLSGAPGHETLALPADDDRQHDAVHRAYPAVGSPERATMGTRLDHGRGFHADACELRFLRGDLGQGGASIMWGRLLGPLLDETALTGTPLAVCLSDFGNAVGSYLPMEEWGYLNTDLTMSLFRRPQGEWICLDGLMQTHPAGIGQATCALHDAHGPIGRSAATLLLTQQGS